MFSPKPITVTKVRLMSTFSSITLTRRRWLSQEQSLGAQCTRAHNQKVSVYNTSNPQVIWKSIWSKAQNAKWTLSSKVTYRQTASVVALPASFCNIVHPHIQTPVGEELAERWVLTHKTLHTSMCWHKMNPFWNTVLLKFPDRQSMTGECSCDSVFGIWPSD